ncbi:DUF3341 domain-containing protein [Tistrella mobilis]|uniref:DUF3341 domain-containing protein n=1 Tax=Tistrella mobilis TaxID=171437 RepID=UPI0035574427
MREPVPAGNVFGMIAQFDDPDRLKEGIRRLRDQGYRRMEAHTPFPIEGLAEMLDFRDNRIAWATFAGGVLGAATGYGMQVYTNLDYVIDIGGRPLISNAAFMLITFELMVLFAVLAGIGAMLLLNRLPRLHHPLFDVPAFHMASTDRFFLVVYADDDRFDPAATRAALEALSPIGIEDVLQGEAPE